MQVFSNMPDFSKENIELAKKKIVEESRYKSFFKAVTATSNQKHYEENLALKRYSVIDASEVSELKKFKYERDV